MQQALSNRLYLQDLISSLNTEFWFLNCSMRIVIVTLMELWRDLNNIQHAKRLEQDLAHTAYFTKI